MRTKLVVLAGLTAAAAIPFLAEGDAAACGGCFSPPKETDSVVTDHRMVLSVSPQQTTLYDQIEYSGSPSSFAWVLPTSGVVTVGLSADILFQTLDQLTTTQVVQPARNCPPPPNCGQQAAFGTAAPGGGIADATAADSGVTVLAQDQVGPYETVQLQSTDPQALTNWLTQNGYNVTADISPVITAYVNAKFDFLAMKLVPGQGVQAMRPVRVSGPGAAPTLPLRMVAAGTGPVTGITLWVVSDGRWEPQNFPFFTITDNQLVWDWTTNSSNYKTLRQQNESSLNGAGWEIESSMSLAQETISSIVLNTYYYGGGDGGGGNGYLPTQSPDGGPGETSDQTRQDDLNTLFAGVSGVTARITRLRSDIAHSALANDLVLQPSQDQSELSNIRNVTKELNQPQCPIYDPNNCNVIGYGPRDQVAADAQGNSAGGSCVAAGPSALPSPAQVAVGGLVGLLGFASVRSRRRRRSSP